MKQPFYNEKGKKHNLIVKLCNFVTDLKCVNFKKKIKFHSLKKMQSIQSQERKL